MLHDNSVDYHQQFYPFNFTWTNLTRFKTSIIFILRYFIWCAFAGHWSKANNVTKVNWYAFKTFRFHRFPSFELFSDGPMKINSLTIVIKIQASIDKNWLTLATFVAAIFRFFFVPPPIVAFVQQQSSPDYSNIFPSKRSCCQEYSFFCEKKCVLFFKLLNG